MALVWTGHMLRMQIWSLYHDGSKDGRSRKTWQDRAEDTNSFGLSKSMHWFGTNREGQSRGKWLAHVHWKMAVRRVVCEM